MIIAVDFDGTIVEHEYPDIGPPVPRAIRTLQDLVAAGHKIILWTMRDGEHLAAAVGYLAEHGVALWGANRNPDQDWSASPKAYAHIYIDDAAVGCPLVRGGEGRPYVNWAAVRERLVADRVLPA